MKLSLDERRTVEAWVEEKFQSIALDAVTGQVDEDLWERIDPWLAQEIEEFAKFERYPGDGRLEGHMVVRVTVTELMSVGIGDPLVTLWAYSEVQRYGANPLSDAEVAELAASRWEPMFMGEETSLESLDDVVWTPRGMSDANADGVGRFARLAGEAGFYVFDVHDHVIIGMDYSIPDPSADRWALLYNNLTGQQIGTTAPW